MWQILGKCRFGGQEEWFGQDEIEARFCKHQVNIDEFKALYGNFESMSFFSWQLLDVEVFRTPLTAPSSRKSGAQRWVWFNLEQAVPVVPITMFAHKIEEDDRVSPSPKRPATAPLEDH